MVNGTKIKKLMKERGITNKEMAETAGLSEAMMCYIIQGFREPNVSAFARIAKKLNVTVDELLCANNQDGQDS